MLWKECIKKIINNEKICLIFIFILCMFSFSCRRCSSVVEHVIGNDGVASPILASGTSFKISAFIAVFLFLNKCLFSPIFEIFIMMILKELSDFLIKR